MDFSGPDDCEFEEKAKPTCHWENVISSAKFTWQRGTGSTPSTGTGPQGDASANYNGSESDYCKNRLVKIFFDSFHLVLQLR